MAEGPGECPEKPPDSGGDGYKIKHSTEYHLASQDGAAGAGHFTITFPDLDSLRSPHPNRMGEQLKLERGVLDLLTHYQLACMDSKDGDFMTCRAMYTFQKDAQELQSMALNDYGQGRLQSVRVATTGHEIAPIPAWMDNGISLQMFFQKKCTSKRGTQSTPGGDNKQGYKIPWRASIQLERVPDNCILTAVQLAFINSDQATGSPSVQIEISSTNATNMYFVNDKLRSINGQTYCECYARGAGTVPRRLLLRQYAGAIAPLPAGIVGRIPAHHSRVYNSHGGQRYRGRPTRDGGAGNPPGQHPDRAEGPRHHLPKDVRHLRQGRTRQSGHLGDGLQQGRGGVRRRLHPCQQMRQTKTPLWRTAPHRAFLPVRNHEVLPQLGYPAAEALGAGGVPGTSLLPRCRSRADPGPGCGAHRV
ncbi:uncharacterized protein LOC129598453 isoform X1 [Paramacrobiotus metropolitanus]|uniref:uncharacterized protein LOC129598453 isoform X1 n=1 Tax=Paramacrobiotus metropolitanus TaxID=2943436 RepID=UPI002445A00A|nr:uncharacterized protein LOC129598453 isoform X1 [Paramacrobiotus metropolitanus]XP_055352333.1 uncharacterized protein LOC129598453 isoform X1 [Paramacrobiotus metropolitanus]